MAPPSRITFREKQFRTLVDFVADRYHAETGFAVGAGARDRLIEPGLPHLADVERSLNDGTINYPTLEGHLRTVLDNARALARQRNRTAIGEDTTEDALKKHCPYLFWC